MNLACVCTNTVHASLKAAQTIAQTYADGACTVYGCTAEPDTGFVADTTTAPPAWLVGTTMFLVACALLSPRFLALSQPNSSM